jgi:SMC interacting uncharacterized protein involved in chromosome segregation
VTPTINLTKPFQLQDATGAPVGTFLPEEALRELHRERDLLRTQLERLREEVEPLRRQADEVQQLRSELDNVKAQRDEYRHTLFSLLPDEEWALTAEDLKEMEDNGCTMEQILAEFATEAGQPRPATDHG